MSEFNEKDLNKVEQLLVRMSMGDLPTDDELNRAVGKIKSGKVTGKSGILPEMTKTACCDTYVFRTLLSLVHSIWKEGVVLQEWAGAVLVPIPKRGNLKSCDNWRGIALLDVVGKIRQR